MTRSEWDAVKKLMYERVREFSKVRTPTIPTWDELLQDIRNKNKKKQ